MECLDNIKIQDYVEGNLSSVENAMVRDHLIVCPACNALHDDYVKLEKFLINPVDIIPPDFIEKNVMKTLFPKLPTYSSIFSLIAASFILLVTSIYIYFDFANNSIVQAFQLTSTSTFDWIGSLVRFIVTTFSVISSIFKVLNQLIHFMLGINIGAEVVGLVFIVLTFLVIYGLGRKAFSKLRS